MKHKLVWLTLLSLGAATLLPGFTLEVNAYDMDWYNANGYMQGIYEPPFLDPNDLGAEIWYDSDPYDGIPPVFTGVYTPYQFGAPGNLPFLTGLYYVDAPGYTDWMPSAIEVDMLFYDESVDFLGLGGVSPDTYTLMVDSMPQGFAVFLDGFDTGYQTPATLVSSYVADLVGTYTLAAPPGYQWVPASYNISVADFQPWRTDYFASINFMLMENFYTVFIGPTVPPGAAIWFNGVDTGFTAPHDFIGTAAEVFGTYTLVLPGYQPLDIVVNADNLTPVIPPLVPLIFTLEINAYDFDWYISNGYMQGVNEPPFLDPNDIQAEIWFDDGLAGPVYTGVQTPYKFGQTGNLPLLDGTYFVQHAQYDDLWQPQSITVFMPSDDLSVDFLGYQLDPPVFDITPDSCDFGTIYDGQDVSQAFIVSNLGGGTLTLTDITLSGSLYFAFSAPPVLPVVLTALDSFEFSVVFTPLGAGDYTASLILTDDLSDAVYGGRNVHTVALSGSSLGVMYVEILPDSLLVGSSAGNVALNVSSNIVWNVTDNADWIDCTPSSGSGDGQVTVSYLANDSTDPRVGTISFMGLDDTVYDTVAVVQGGIPYLAVTPDSMTVTPEAGVVSVNLQSNVFWNASWTEDWIVSCTPASGVGSAIVSLAYVANTTNDPRSAVIFFFGPAGSGLASPFVLNQSAIPFLAITPDNANVAHEAGVLSLNVEANLDWTVGEAEDWIVCSPNSGSGDGVINVSYDANPDDSLRVGIITVSGPGGDPSVPFILTQNPAPYLIVTPDSLTVAAEGGDLTLELSSNVAWTVTADTDWISCLPTSGTGDSSITVTYMANTSSEPRQGHVTIQILGGGMSDSFTLFQQGVVTVDDDVQVPATTSLLGIYPNPFRGNTKIKYALANAAPYSLYVYNIRGDRVRNLKSGVGQPGLYMVAWDGRDERGTLVGSGIYYLVLRSGSQLFSRRLTLLK